MNYTLIFEDKKENTQSKDIQFILEVFNQINLAQYIKVEKNINLELIQ